jgi:hypothetical protein
VAEPGLALSPENGILSVVNKRRATELKPNIANRARSKLGQVREYCCWEADNEFNYVQLMNRDIMHTSLLLAEKRSPSWAFKRSKLKSEKKSYCISRRESSVALRPLGSSCNCKVTAIFVLDYTHTKLRSIENSPF